MVGGWLIGFRVFATAKGYFGLCAQRNLTVDIRVVLGGAGPSTVSGEALGGPRRLWEVLGASGRLGSFWEALGETLGGSGRLWEALAGSGKLWEALGGSGRL